MSLPRTWASAVRLPVALAMAFRAAMTNGHKVSLKGSNGTWWWHGFVWKCWVNIPNYSHLIGIMISKTIGFRGTQHFQTHPHGKMPLSKEYNMIVKSWELHSRSIYRPTISYSLHPMYHSCFATWHFGSHRSWSRVLGLAHLWENNLAPYISPSNCQHQEWGMLSGLVALVIIYMLL